MSSFRLRRVAAAISFGLMLAVVISSATFAAPRPITFEIFIGDSCVFGRAANNSFLKVVIHDRAGSLKGRGAVEADGQGYWQACMPQGVAVLTGDKISGRVFDTTQSRNFTVPLLTGKVDRGTNVVSGKAPAGTKVQLEAFDFRFDLWGETYDVTHDVVASSGSFAYDFDADGVDIRGGASVVIRWRNSGDTVQVGRFQIAPYLNMQIGRSDVAGASSANGAIKVTLRDASSNVLATATGVGTYGDTSFYATYADSDGEPYTLKGGERLSAPALGGQSSWHVPAIKPKADLALETVSGTCFPNGRVMAIAQNLNGFDYGLEHTTAAADGKFTVDLSAQLNIKAGFRLAVLCYSRDGDEVVQEATAR